MKKTGRKTALYGLFIALAMVLSYVEGLVPVFVATPGVKVGLANIVVVFALYYMGEREAVVIGIVRVLLSGLTFGNLFSLMYSAAGCALSLISMLLLKRTGKFSMSGISVAGGVMHNVGQIIVAIMVTKTSQIIYYLPVLCISGVAAGLVIGLLAAALLRRIKPYNKQ